MGSVTNVQTTGDNDPELFPVSYYNHYMYCDQCGSFEFEDWIEPLNIEELRTIEKWIFRLAIIFAAAGIFWMILTFTLNWLLIASIVLCLAGAFGYTYWVEGKIKNMGIICKGCEAHHPPGSSFFQSLEENPRNLSMKDVPRPLYKAYQIRGKSLEE